MNRAVVAPAAWLAAAAVWLAPAAPASAAVSVVGATAPAPSSSAVTTATLTRASIAGLAANDLLLVQLAIRGGGGIAIGGVPSGWTLVRRTNQGNAVAQAVYRRLVGPLATEPATYTWTFTSERAALTAIALRGVDAVSPVIAEGGSTTSASTSIAAPGVSTNVDGAMHVVMVSADDGNGSFAPPATLTGPVQAATGAGPNGITLALGAALEATAGALNAPWSVPYSSAQSGVGHTVALRPDANVATLNHLRIEHASGTGLTCTPSTLTLRACQDAACATPYTGGVSGSMSAAGGSVVWPGGSAFSIAAGASTTAVPVQLTAAGSRVLGATASAPVATGATLCNFGSPACSFVASDAGLLFDVPHHVAETVQTIGVSAVKKSDGSLACVPAFANASRTVAFRCSYTDPASGTLPVRVGGRALNAANDAGAACDAGGQSVPLAFNANGVASTTVAYADVGRLSLVATYTGSVASGDPGLVMSGSDDFVAAPASFGFSAIDAAPLRAGVAFAATVTARNAAGTATPNFGREAGAEGATISFARRFPTGAGASDGAFGGSLGGFSLGSATATHLVWTEVGSGDLAATLASGSYLGSGFSASGSTGASGAVGPFIPHHFDVAVTPACAAAFSYAGQPFAVTVTARNGLSTPGTTVNYDGSGATSPNHAKAVTLSDAPALGLGSLAGAGIAASAFTAGRASASPSYAFGAKLTAPQTLVLRATDANAVSSNGHAEGSTLLRSGRLRLVNAFGSATQPLQVPVLAEYWSGNAWLPNNADSCTTVPAAAVAISNPRNHQGGPSAASTGASAITIAGGSAVLVLAAPSPPSSVGFDLALNLGSAAVDQSCHPSHPATTGAARAWLRSNHGACAPTADRDPAARATFGIYSPENRRTVHVRELY